MFDHGPQAMNRALTLVVREPVAVVTTSRGRLLSSQSAALPLTPTGKPTDDLDRFVPSRDSGRRIGRGSVALRRFVEIRESEETQIAHRMRTKPRVINSVCGPPGERSSASFPTPYPPDDGAVDEPEPHPDYERASLDQITDRVRQDFAGHALSDLVAAVLEVDGYECQVSPPGPDGGIDISAGRGPLGLDPPRLVVQVKSGSGQVGVSVVNQLQGVMSTLQADQGLLVVWAGLTTQARNALQNRHLRVRVWQADDVVEAVLRTYAHLPERLRAMLPLKRMWVLSHPEGG